MDNKEENIIASNTENKEKAGIAENFAAPSVENAAEKAKVIPPVEQYVPGIMPVPQKKKSYAGRVVALAVCCTLTGALLGAGGVIVFNSFHGHGRMRMGGFRQGAGVVRQYDRQNFGDNNTNNSSGNSQNGNRGQRDKNRSGRGQGQQYQNRQNQNDQNNQNNRNNQNRQNRNKQNRHGQSGQQGNGNAQTPDVNGQTPNSQTPNSQAPDGNSQAPNAQAPGSQDPASDSGAAN